MDVRDVEQLLRENARRFDEEISEIDAQNWRDEVLRRIGIDPAAVDRPDPQSPPR